MSIVTPVYNRADCIIQCLKSVANQATPSDWEIEHLVTDDGSSDTTPDKVEEYSLTHPLVKFSKLPKNRGTNGARNEAIARASGRWIVFLDSDDVMLPGAVDTICRTIDANPHMQHFLFATDDTIHLRSNLGKHKVLEYEDFLFERIKGDFVHVLQRQNLLKLPFREDLRIFEGIFFLFYYKEAGSVLYSSEVIYHRNRERTDHVTYSLGMTNDKALKTKLASKQLLAELYSDDYKKSEDGLNILTGHLLTIHRLAVLINNKEAVQLAKSGLTEIGRKAPLAERIVYSCRTGYAIWTIIKLAVRIKRFLKRQL